MNRLIRITKPEDVFPQYRNTPISMLLEYHNLNREFETYSQAHMLISMCMDNRKHLNIPDNFTLPIATAKETLNSL
jgi:carbonic anhydrase